MVGCVPDFHNIAVICRNLLGGDADFVIVCVCEFYSLFSALITTVVDHVELSQIIDNIGIACVIIIYWIIVRFSGHAHTLAFMRREAERIKRIIPRIPHTVILPGDFSAHRGGAGSGFLTFETSRGCIAGA